MIVRAKVFGNVPLRTIRRDFNRLREAVRRHDTFATEDAWDKCERWLPFIENGCTPYLPQETPHDPE